MKVVLIADVPALGKKGEIKEVKPGYARNFLLGRYAVLPGDPEVAALQQERKVLREKETMAKEQESATLEKISGKKFTFKAKVDKKGKLYGSIGPKEISKKLGINENLVKEHFKELGTFNLALTIANKKVSCQIEIVKES